MSGVGGGSSVSQSRPRPAALAALAFPGPPTLPLCRPDFVLAPPPLFAVSAATLAPLVETIQPPSWMRTEWGKTGAQTTRVPGTPGSAHSPRSPLSEVFTLGYATPRDVLPVTRYRLSEEGQADL